MHEKFKIDPQTRTRHGDIDSLRCTYTQAPSSSLAIFPEKTILRFAFVTLHIDVNERLNESKRVGREVHTEHRTGESVNIYLCMNRLTTK